MKARLALVKQLEKMLSLVEKKKRVLKKTSEKLIRTYWEQDTVAGNSVVWLVKSIATLLVSGSDVPQQVCYVMVLERVIKPGLFQQGPGSELNRWLEANFQE